MSITKQNDETGSIFEPSNGDLDAMVKIFIHGQLFHHNAFPDIFCEPPNDDAIASHFMGFLRPESKLKRFLKLKNPLTERTNFAIGWRQNEQLTGYLLYHLYLSSNVFNGNNKWTSMVYDIAVDPDFRKRGIARHLLTAYKSKVQSLGGCTVYANIWNGNTGSLALFDAAGFKPVSTQFHLHVE